jgi:hypothetical protein
MTSGLTRQNAWQLRPLRLAILLVIWSILFQHVSSLISSLIKTKKLPTVETLPSWLPGTSWRQEAVDLRQSLDTFVDTPHEWVKQQLVGGVFLLSVNLSSFRAGHW